MKKPIITALLAIVTIDGQELMLKKPGFEWGSDWNAQMLEKIRRYNKMM